MGLSPGQYINQLRMRKAVELIRNTDKKMSEIAGIVGYADQYAFSKAFKRTFVDIAPLLSDADGELRPDLTKDGIHLHPAGYLIWTERLKQLKYLK